MTRSVVEQTRLRMTMLVIDRRTWGQAQQVASMLQRAVGKTAVKSKPFVLSREWLEVVEEVVTSRFGQQTSWISFKETAAVLYPRSILLFRWYLWREERSERVAWRRQQRCLTRHWVVLSANGWFRPRGDGWLSGRDQVQQVAEILRLTHFVTLHWGFLMLLRQLVLLPFVQLSPSLLEVAQNLTSPFFGLAGCDWSINQRLDKWVSSFCFSYLLASR